MANQMISLITSSTTGSQKC